jgi:acetoin:2,6-dichlorophenolindophenol oxidoreductase subunit beta
MPVTEQQATTTLTMSQAINRAITEALEREEPMVLLGQDIGEYGGTFGVYRGLYERFGADVVRDGPLCESATVGFGVGVAAAGVRCIVEVEFMDFLGVAMDQIVNQAAKLHSTTNGKLTVPLVLRTPVVSRMGMGSQHSQSLESWFMHIPGLKVAMPSNANDAYGLLRTALQDQNPVLFIENARLYGRRGEVELDADPIPFGQVRVAREGTDATVVALGGMVDDALAAAKTLEAEGISVEVIDPRTISPLDVDGIIASLAKTMKLAVVHEAHKTAGFGAEVAALCVEHGFEYLDAPIERVAALDVPIPCGPEWSAVYPDADSIAAAVRRLCGAGA